LKTMTNGLSIRKSYYYTTDYNSFTESQTYEVYKSVIDVTTKLLCQKTKFQMIVNEKDSCSTTKTDSSTSLTVTQFLADLDRLDVMVRDVNYTWVESQGDDSDDDDTQQQSKITIQWVEFFIHYPILHTGSDVNNSKAVAFDIARAKIKNAINDNTFTKKLVLKSDLIIAVANVGDEETVFSPWAQLWESLAATSNFSSDERIPPPTQTAVQEQQAFSLQSFFYPIRIAGLILLGITIFVVTFMICLAEKRKIIRELEEQDILPLAESNLRSLHTNEGLNAILDGGRQVALQKRMNFFT